MPSKVQNKQLGLLPFSLNSLTSLQWSYFILFIFYCDYLGLSTSHFAWAFHSVAEEELLSMLPAMQKGDPTWSELRAMGIGWWVRNIHSLRKCIEKVKIVL